MIITLGVYDSLEFIKIFSSILPSTVPVSVETDVIGKTESATSPKPSVIKKSFYFYELIGNIGTEYFIRKYYLTENTLRTKAIEAH